MKDATEMDSGAIIYIPNFVKIGSPIMKLIGGYTDTHRAWKSHKPTFIFTLISLILKNKSGLMQSPCCLCACEFPSINL
jgi:hypothetical protein